MKSLELIIQQRQEERKILKLFLAGSLLASLALHVGAMTLRVGNFWSTAPALDQEEDEIEVLVTEEVPEEVPLEEPEPVVQELEPVPEEVAVAPPIPLAPNTQVPDTPGEDAPSNAPPAPNADPVSPLTNAAGDTPATETGSGPTTSPDGTGDGFGNADKPSGFTPGGTPEGSPDGMPGGQPNGKPEGEQTAARPTTPAIPPVKPQEPVCLSCPRPEYKGVEAAPRVDLKIRPDGSTEVRLRKSSGNPEVDRATLEAMSKWRFDPKTVPQEGFRKRVRVTYEEEGSRFQRENEQRRRQEAERRQIAEQEQRRREAAQPSKKPGNEVIEAPAKNPTAPVVPAPAPPPEPIAAPPPAPVYEPPPAPVYEPPPAPVYEPPPAPVYEPPPAPAEVPAVQGN